MFSSSVSFEKNIPFFDVLAFVWQGHFVIIQLVVPELSLESEDSFALLIFGILFRILRAIFRVVIVMNALVHIAADFIGHQVGLLLEPQHGVGHFFVRVTDKEPEIVLRLLAFQSVKMVQIGLDAFIRMGFTQSMFPLEQIQEQPLPPDPGFVQNDQQHGLVGLHRLTMVDIFQ